MTQPTFEPTCLASHPFIPASRRRTWGRFLLGILGIAWVALSATLCGCRPMSGYVMNESGKGYYRRGNYMAARMEFERALMDRPHSADYAYNLAAAMAQTGDAASAEQMYRHALLLDPSHQPSYHGLASLMNMQGRSGEAQMLVQSWVDTQPYMPEPHLEMSWLMQQQGNLLAAEESAHQALRIDPRHPRAMAHLGQIYARGGRRGEAAAMYRRSLAMNPYQTSVSSDLAYLSYPQGYSPGVQMANTMPYFDPALQGGPVLAGPGWGGPGIGGRAMARRNPFAGGPMMTWQQPYQQPMQMGTYVPTQAPMIQSSPMIQSAPTVNAPITTVPAYSGAPAGVPFGAPTSVPYGTPLPLGPATQPVQLGAPIPTTMAPGQFYSANGAVIQTTPISGSWNGVVTPQVQYGQPVIIQQGYTAPAGTTYPVTPISSPGTLPYPAASGAIAPPPVLTPAPISSSYYPTSATVPSSGPAFGAPAPSMVGFNPPQVQAF